MPKKEIIKQQLSDFHLQALPQVHPRKLQLPLNVHKIITLSGVRGAGKTYLMYALMQRLLKKGVKKEQLVYINFEDERLNFQAEELELILESYRELFIGSKLNKVYFFFDEGQNVPGFSKFIRRIVDTVSPYVFVTGSNAHFLSSEIATELRGRSINYEVFPLSFQEYCEFNQLDLKAHDSLNKAKVRKAFSSFLVMGGFPELLTKPKVMQEKILQEYFNIMLYRDLVERYELTNLSVVKYFIRRVLESITNPLSINKIYNELKSRGYKIGKNFLYELIQQMEAIYLALPLKKHTNPVLKQELAMQKYYAIDNGLLNALSYNFTHDHGKLLENLVYLEFKKAKLEMAFIRNTHECDFVLYKRESIERLIQVSYTLNDPVTRARELKSLLMMGKELKQKRVWLLTLAEEEMGKEQGIEFVIMPVYKYLLNEHYAS